MDVVKYLHRRISTSVGTFNGLISGPMSTASGFPKLRFLGKDRDACLAALKWGNADDISIISSIFCENDILIDDLQKR